MRPEPPRLARLLVSLATRRANRGSVVQDLREEFHSMLADGVPLADSQRWYWIQVIDSVLPLMAARQGPGKLIWRFFGSEGGMLQDMKVGARMLLRRPGFSLIVVLTLALGIGATSAVFSLIQGVLLTPPPYEDPDRIALLTPVFLEGQEGRPPDWAAEQWLTWREDAELFETIAAYRWAFNFLISDEGSESLEGMRVTHNYFRATGLEPVIGRVFEESETGSDEASPAIIIGHDLWMRRFGGDAGVLGQTLPMSRMSPPPVVIGVMPPGVRFLPYARAAQEPNYDVDAKVDFWMPAEVTRASEPRTQAAAAWSVVGRLNEGVAPAVAEAEIGLLAAQQAEADPRYEGIGVRVEPVIDVMNSDGRRILLPLLAAAALVLLIACGNAAALLLVRGLQRQQEYGVRSAIGAGRLALLRLVTVESLLLALAGGTLGVGIALGVVRGFKLVAGHAIPRLDAVDAGWPVILFGLGSALLATVVAGLYPALRASRDSSAGSLQGSGMRTTAGRRERRFLAGVTMMQAALTLTLLVGAGLLIRTMNNLAGVEAGYETDRVLTMSVTAVNGNASEFHTLALESVSSLPGVERAAFAWGVPLTGNNWGTDILIEDRVAPNGPNERVPVPVRSVTPDYFELLGQTILEGRSFRTSDDGQGTPVAVVNQAFVDRYFAGSSGLGRRFNRRARDTWQFEIVGVVSDGRTDDLTQRAQPEVYLSFWQAGAFTKHLIVRTAGDPGTTAVAVQQALHAVEPTVAVENVLTLGQIREDSLASRNFAMQLLIGFALVACVLTLGGIYGMLSLAVASRRREIAIRTALGAGKNTVLQLVVREGVLVIAVGLAVGLVAAAGLSRVLGAFLFGVESTDPATLIVMGSLFAAVALLACWIPARRAAEADPVAALREE